MSSALDLKGKSGKCDLSWQVRPTEGVGLSFQTKRRPPHRAPGTTTPLGTPRPEWNEKEENDRERWGDIGKPEDSGYIYIYWTHDAWWSMHERLTRPSRARRLFGWLMGVFCCLIAFCVHVSVCCGEQLHVTWPQETPLFLDFLVSSSGLLIPRSAGLLIPRSAWISFNSMWMLLQSTSNLCSNIFSSCPNVWGS